MTIRKTALRGLAALALLLALFVSSLDSGVHAQHDLGGLFQQEGAEAEPEELDAWTQVEAGNLIRARGHAERIIARDPQSYVAHLVLAHVHHYAEASFPRALFHAKRARELYERRHGSEPSPAKPWRWHSMILRELGDLNGKLERYEAQLQMMTLFNEQFEPKLIGERAWPLMKLRRFDDARLAVEAAFATGDPWQKALGLNALCAIEFEAGDNLASYRACREALDAGRLHGRPSTVDLTNFAEASRSLFKLDEAERILLEATELEAHWYANPWLELSDLLIREGRYAEALSGLKRVATYRGQRPAHVRDADRNETRRVIAAFLVTIGRAEEALEITSKALVTPDRRAHTSRDAFQDRSLVALLDRRARRLVAEHAIERSVARPWYERLLAWGEATWTQLGAWRSGRQALTLLASDDRLVGIFQIGTKHAAIQPPWIAGDLVEILGSGVVLQALRRARASDPRPGSDAYYDAFAAEAFLRSGAIRRAQEHAERAHVGLPSSELLLRTRALALVAEAKRLQGEAAAGDYDRIFQLDPGVLRRLELTVPVRIEASAGEVSAAIRDGLSRSPRFAVEAGGLTIRVDATPASGRICLEGVGGSTLACADAEAKTTDDPSALAQRCLDAFHTQAFAPRIDLTQADLHSLDGSPHQDRGGLGL